MRRKGNKYVLNNEEIALINRLRDMGFKMPMIEREGVMPNEVHSFTDQQLKNWKKYETVRVSGKGGWNMFSREAMKAAKMDREEYRFCMDNYSALRQAVHGKNSEK